MMRKRIWKCLFLLSICIVIAPRLNASHIVGGDISVKWISGNTFEVTLNFFRDCKNANPGAGFDNPIPIGLYDKNSDNMLFSFPITLVSQNILQLGDLCNPISTNQLCVEQGVYKTNITIPDNPNGYYLSWSRCCRNSIINNITDPAGISPGNAGMVFYAEIPDPALHNSTPTFGNYPNAYMCVGQTNTKDFSCIDIDGDSLVYSLVTPFNGSANSTNSIPAPPLPQPYSLVRWTSGYSNFSMIGGSPPMRIDSTSGIITANPSSTSLGFVFVFAVRVEEYDKATKIKLGEIRRDIQYTMLPCNVDLPPDFTTPVENSFNIFAGDSLCFNLRLDDPNISDSVKYTATSELFTLTSGNPTLLFAPQKGVKTISSKFCIQTYCESIRENPYSVSFKGEDSSCYGVNTVTKNIDFYVYTLDGTLKDPIPNVFTPNGDGKNDTLKVNATVNNCYDKFWIKIYDRWGDKVFESTDFLFAWTGKHYRSGKELTPGLYFYVLEGSFREHAVKRKGTVTLVK